MGGETYYEAYPHLQERLVFLVGDFSEAETLRRGIWWRPDKAADEKNKKQWINATFAAYAAEPSSHAYNPERDSNDPMVKLDGQGRAFRFFMHRVEKCLMITKEIQEVVRNRIREGKPVLDRYGVLPVFEHGGIIPYNHGLLREAQRGDEREGLTPVQRRVLSIVVAESSSGGSLDDAIEAEFVEGADVFMTGIRPPSEYLDLIKAWFAGNVNPKKYSGAAFNRERFSVTRGGLLTPTNVYDGPETDKSFLKVQLSA